VSTKFVQIKALGLKLALPGGGTGERPQGHHGPLVFYKNLKKILKSLSLDNWHEHLLVDVLQVCSIKSPRIKIGPAPGVIDFPYMYMVKS
jgi:hypothetical protein